MQKAAAIKSNSPKAWFHLGDVQRDSGSHEQAIESFKKATELKPDYAEAYENLVGIMQLNGLYRELIDVCREAVTVIQDNAELYASMAGALEQTSQLDAVKEAAETALGIDASHARALFTLARVERRRHDFSAARDRLRSLMSMPLQPAQMSAVAGELGEVLDRMKEYDEAFKAFTHANNVMLRTVPQQARQGGALYDKIRSYRDFFKASAVSDWSAPEDGVSDPVFLVGFPVPGRR